MILFLLLTHRVLAEVAPVTVRVPEPEAWIGQRLSLHVELRAPGSFTGSASFDLPQIPGTLLMKIGNPVVSSETTEGKSWFVQTHEFALFSQKSGPLEVPSFPVRFEHQEGFTGPSILVETRTPATTVEIQRPPGSEAIGFLITTESLELTETWDPAPGPSQVGAVFKRTITQRAPDITGMALAPAPGAAPDGFRVYPGEAATKDKLERGDFLGERRETITYLVQQPGTLTLPAITYAWWNPTTRTLESKTLPAVTFDVAAPPAAATSTTDSRNLWPWLAAAAWIAIGVWQRKRLADRFHRLWKALHPPDRTAARNLLSACRRNDAPAASAAWTAWRDTRPAGYQPPPDLQSAVLAMQRHRFGPAPASAWQGDDLARAFQQQSPASSLAQREVSPLPPLNP
jgi:hypothetical protein